MFSVNLPELQDRDYDELNSLLAQLDSAARAVDVAKAAVIAEVERTKGYERDGQHSPTTWLRGSLRCSTSEALRLHRLAKTIVAQPEVGKALTAGDLTSCAARDLARVYANPRVHEQFASDVTELISTASTIGHRDFQQHLRAWEIRADRDGALKRNEDAYDRRAGSVVTINETTTIDIALSGAEGYEAREIFERFITEEIAADLETRSAAEQRGEPADDPAWNRTHLQRGADAMLRIMRAAAHTEGSVPADDPIVNVIVDQQTFEDAIAHATNTAPETVSPAGTRRVCETSNGNPLLPAEMLAAALRGRIRRVVYDDDGVVINLGHTRRLFTGSARVAVKLSGRHCLWPGCYRSVRDCESDHIIEHSKRGPTDQANAGINCPRHNRERNRGFKLERIPSSFGQFYVYRPNGQRIGPRSFPFGETADSPVLHELRQWFDRTLNPTPKPQAA